MIICKYADIKSSPLRHLPQPLLDKVASSRRWLLHYPEANKRFLRLLSLPTQRPRRSLTSPPEVKTSSGVFYCQFCAHTFEPQSVLEPIMNSINR
jgi:hypothetical protein